MCIFGEILKIVRFTVNAVSRAVIQMNWMLRAAAWRVLGLRLAKVSVQD